MGARAVVGRNCWQVPKIRVSKIMARIFVAFVLLTLATGGLACPNAEDLKPCTCNEKGINCNAITNVDDLVLVFTAYSDDPVVEAVWLQETPIDNLPDNVFAKYRISNFHLNDNHLTQFSFGTLSGSEQTALVLNLSGNKLSSFPFDKITVVPNMSVLDVERNAITELAKFPRHSGLQLLDLSDNLLASIPADAFAALPNLVRVDLGNNRLATLGPRSLATGHSILRIILSQNQIADIDDDAMSGMWAPNLDLNDNRLTVVKESVFRKAFAVVTQQSGKINLKNNPLTCQGCDYKWIVDSRATAKRVFSGFTCEDNRILDDLNADNIAC